jgi:Zn finger protein HypA/HybF involved in hydrogenase expression
MVNEEQPELQCVCCEHNTPTQGQRICPLCGHKFRGNGWDGVDAHWRSQHRDIMTYEQFWHSLCEEHRDGAARGDSRATGSVVENLRKDLERSGEYVVRANISSGWFAVFPRTWQIRTDAAKRNGREGPTLIVYRTNSGDPRDYYAIPYDVVRDLLVGDTITHSEVNGSRRWNLTLKSGRLHVTHQPGTTDVSGYHGVPLIVERNGSLALGDVHLAFDERFTILEGIARELTVTARSRSRKLRGLALRRSRGICEACGTDYSALLEGKGIHVLQVHHRRQLALQDVPKLTSPDDLAVVCANCHAIIHADCLNAMSVETLSEQWRRERT